MTFSKTGSRFSQLGRRNSRELLTSIAVDAISSRPALSGLLTFKQVLDMTGTARSSEGLDERRKRLLYRCWHRGTREMDLVMGRFADAHIANLSETELEQLERLGDLPEPDLYAALSGTGDISPEFANGIFYRIKSFRAADHDT